MSDEGTIGDNVHLPVCGDVILFEDGKEEIASKELNGYLGDGYWKHHGSSNLDELSEILDGVMLRRLAVDEEPDLGKPLMYEVLLELPDNLQEKYEIGCSEINNTDYKSTQERSILAGLKGGVLNEHLKIVQQAHSKIVVFYHHKAISRYMMARNDRKVFKIDGGMSTKKKHTTLNDFVKSKYATLFAQSQAAGTGLDGIQHGASTGV